jgi:hypothetical protein
VAINERLHEFEPDLGHGTWSHSFSPAIACASAGLPATTTILPSLSTSTRATSTPAATTPFTALVTSDCLNVHAPRGVGYPPRAAPLPTGIVPCVNASAATLGCNPVSGST